MVAFDKVKTDLIESIDKKIIEVHLESKKLIIRSTLLISDMYIHGDYIELISNDCKNNIEITIFKSGIDKITYCINEEDQKEYTIYCKESILEIII